MFYSHQVPSVVSNWCLLQKQLIQIWTHCLIHSSLNLSKFFISSTCRPFQFQMFEKARKKEFEVVCRSVFLRSFFLTLVTLSRPTIYFCSKLVRKFFFKNFSLADSIFCYVSLKTYLKVEMIIVNNVYIFSDLKSIIIHSKYNYCIIIINIIKINAF